MTATIELINQGVVRVLMGHVEGERNGLTVGIHSVKEKLFVLRVVACVHGIVEGQINNLEME